MLRRHRSTTILEDTKYQPRLEMLEQRLAMTASLSACDNLPLMLSHGGGCACPVCSGEGLQNLFPADMAQAGGTGSGDLAPSSPLSSLPQLSSNSAAQVKLYLDFNGHFQASWGSYQNVTTPVFDRDGDATTFSASEIATIQEIWSRVAEDYAPFNVDVTTVDPGNFAPGNAVRLAIGGNYSDWFGQSAGGVAYINGFTNGINTGYVFEDALGNGTARYVAEATSHEAGHLFGLRHQSTWVNGQLQDQYNSGNANWAPIMGTGYSSARTTWHNGTTNQGANVFQDDVSILAGATNNFGLRADDFSSSFSTPSNLPASGTSINFAGLIGSRTDVDVFQFSTSGGTASFQMTVAQFGNNLDGVIEIRDSSSNVVSISDPSNSFGASLSTNLSAGSYFLVVRGTGPFANSAYGNMGQYAITGTLPSLPPSPEVSVLVGATGIADGGTIDFGSTPPGTAVDRVVTVRNDGTADLSVDAITSAIPAGFTLVSNLSTTTLQAGQSVTFTLRFDALSGGSYSGNISFTNSDANEATYNLHLQGNVITPTSTVGLVARYTFNEGAGTTVIDASGNNNLGNIVGATWSTAGRYGNALSFNGTNNRVDVLDASSLRLSSAMTLEAWVNPTALSTAWRNVIYKGNVNYYLNASSSNAGSPVGGGTFGGTTRGSIGPAALAANTWTHLAATYDGSMIRLFVNGTQVSSTAMTGAITSSTNLLQIGGNSISGQYFSGLIDEVRVYSRALSQLEILADMSIAGDVTDPAVSNVSSAGLTESGATITWNTDEAADTQIDFGTSTSYGSSSTRDMSLATSHTVNLTGLAASTTYHYRVRSRDALGNLAVSGDFTFTTAADATAPTISGIATSNLSATGVTVAFTTDEPADTQVEYGTSTSYGSSTALNTSLVTSHSASLAGLTANTTYHYRIRTRDASGNLELSGDLTFTTPAANAGPVAAYTFNEGAGSTVIDASGHNNLGTIVGATWTTAGRYGRALSFNGTNSRVDIVDTASLHLSSAMTMSAWVNPATLSSAWQNVIYKGNVNYYLNASSSNAGNPVGGGTFGGTTRGAIGPAALPANTWTYLAATYDGSMIRLYVNGTQVSSTAMTGAITSSTNLLQIGGNSISGQYFRGLIDEVRVYDRALAQGEIQADMNSAGDLTAPTISTVAITNRADTRATINWNTNEAADTQVDFGTSTSYGSSCTLNMSLVTSHSVNLTGLAASTTYHYRIRSRDASGNLTLSGDMTFTTGTSTAGLVANYTFSEGTGSTVIDASGNSNLGTIVGATWTTAGRYGNALSFDGTSRVDILDSASLRLTSAMTLEAWVNPASVSTAWQDVIYKGNVNYYLIASSSNGGAPVAGGTISGSTGGAVGTAPLAANTWSHLAATYNGTAIRLYVNGVEVASRAATGSILTSANPLQIGGNTIASRYFTGLIDEVRVYSRALTQAEIQADMNFANSAALPTLSGEAAPTLEFAATHVVVVAGTTSFGNIYTGSLTSSVEPKSSTEDRQEKADLKLARTQDAMFSHDSDLGPELSLLEETLDLVRELRRHTRAADSTSALEGLLEQETDWLAVLPARRSII